MNMRYFLFLLYVLLISACTTQAPLPTDHYYRLPELTGITAAEKQFDSISVITFQADGLYKERALVYTKDGIELNQYHYHHWVDSPTRLLQERLAEKLRLNKFANIVLTTFDGNSELVVRGKIKSFEKVSNENENIHVKLILQVNSSSDQLPVLHKEYIKVVAIESESMISSVKAYAEAVDSIFNEFYADLIEII